MNGRYGSTVLGDDWLIPMTPGTRSELLNLERWLVENDPEMMNNGPWAIVCRRRRPPARQCPAVRAATHGILNRGPPVTVGIGS
jgi:hypothetical protein